MITSLVAAVSNLILFVIQKTGYAGIFALMFLQSINIPIPSEITMPFSGFLASQGNFNFWIVVLIGAVGNLIGAYLSYKLAVYIVKNEFRSRHPFLGKLLNERSLKIAQNWFEKYGAFSVFFSRMVPVISTFISFPAGLAQMNISIFLLLTFLGSLIWSFALARIGFVLGQNWETIQVYFRGFDYLILALILVAIVAWVIHHYKKRDQNG